MREPPREPPWEQQAPAIREQTVLLSSKGATAKGATGSSHRGANIGSNEGVSKGANSSVFKEPLVSSNDGAFKGASKEATYFGSK